MMLLENVNYAYDGIYPALNGVSLQIDSGERVALMGGNGAGKTTLLKHMNGLLRPQQGRVFLDGRDSSEMSVAEMSKKVGLVWQNPDHQLFLDSVKKEVVFGLEKLGFDEEESTRKCSQTLARLGLGDLADRSPFSLSGGERKRVALASILVTEPKFLALDEPTIGQDARQKEKLASLIMELNESGCTVLCVTHDIEFVVEHFPRTIAMSDGVIIADGDTESVLTNDYVVERTSLAYPELVRAARALRRNSIDVPEKTTQLVELETALLRILGGS